MKKLLKLNPDYLIGIGIIVTCIGGFFDVSSDIGLGFLLLGCSSVLLGAVLGLVKKKKS